MLLKADSQGFLIGYSLQGDKAEALLSSIHKDSSQILALLRRTGDVPRLPAVSAPRVRSRASEAPRMFDMGPSSPREMASSIAREMLTGGAAASPGHRAAITKAVRKAADSDRREARLADVAVKAQALTRDAVTVRRQEIVKDQKEAAAARLRDGRGRFSGSGKSGDPGATPGSGAPGAPDKKPGKGGGSGGSLHLGANIGEGVGAALEATQQVDQLLGSANEAKGLYGNLKSAVRPLGRAGSALIGSMRRPGASKEGKEQTGLLRKLLRQGEKKGNGNGTADGGGLFSSLMSLIPGLGSLVTQAGLITGSAAVGASLTALAGAGMQLIVKNLPILGALFAAWDGFTEVSKDQADANLSADEKSRRGARAVGGVAGAMAGAIGGGAMGTALFGPVGGLIGAGMGGYMGYQSGRAAGSTTWARFNGVKGNLMDAADKAGVDPAMLARITAFESGFNPSAKNPYSSAHGLGQFTNATWADSVRKWGGKYGIGGASVLSDAGTMEYRNDAQLQANMLAELTAENVKLGRQLGGFDDAANVYALHNLGKTGGSNFLTALQRNPGAAVSTMLSPQVISGNKSLYGDGSVSFTEAYKNMGGAMNLGLKYGDAMTTALPGGLKMPGMPSMPLLPSVGAAPAIDWTAATRVNSPMTAAAQAPSPPAGRDVADRGIAHITTGGMGLPTFSR